MEALLAVGALSAAGYLAWPVLATVSGPPAASPFDYNLSSSGGLSLSVHLPSLVLSIVQQVLSTPLVVKSLAIFALMVVCLASFAALVSQRIANGVWLTRRMSKAAWREQVVLVTGGSGGVGVELCKLLSSDRVGATVISVDIRPSPLQSSRQEQRIGRIHFWTDVDISEAESIAKLAAQIQSRVGSSPTILINNAGVTSARPVTLASDQSDPGQTRKVVNVNLLSHFWILQQFLPAMSSRGSGHVVEIASIMGNVGVPRMSDYVASKFGVVGLYETLVRELRQSRGSSSSSYPIQSTLILPGHISTPMFSHWRYPFPFNYLTPSITPQSVAKSVFVELDRRRSRTIYLPRMTATVKWMRVLPKWLEEVGMRLAGTDDAVEGMARRAARVVDDVPTSSPVPRRRRPSKSQ